MATASLSNTKHARSISLPSQSHPLTLTAEEHLYRLVSASEATSSSSTICQNLDGLVDLYDSVDNLLHMPLFQQAAAHEQHGQWMEEVLDGSLCLLDVCGSTRDAFSQMKKDLQILQSAFRRRRGDESNLVNEVGTFISIRNKMNKDTRKCLQDLKKLENKCTSLTLLDKGNDADAVAVVRVLREMEAVTLSILKSSLGFISGTKANSRTTGWSLISKVMQSKRIACDGDEAKLSEMKRVDNVLNALIGQKSSKGINVMQIQNANEGLQSLEGSINNVEGRLDCVFKRLVKFRVTILNIIHH